MLLITLKKNELVYDIEYMSWKVAKVHFLDDQPLTAPSMAVNQDSDRDFVDRLLESAIANVKSELQWCIDSRRHNVATDMVSPDRREYDMVLNIDDDRRNVADALCSAIHDYVVCYATYRFFLLTAPSFAPSLAELAESHINRAYSLARNNMKYKYHCLWNASN